MRKNEIFSDAGKNWVLLIKIHVVAILCLIGYFVLASRSAERIPELIAMVLTTSLFLQMFLYRVRPNWFKAKKDRF
jgi:hypothetical protein